MRLTASTAVRLLYGGLLLAFPRRVVTALGGNSASSPAVNGVRVLGARHLVQGAIVASKPTATRLRVGAAVDVVHAATMALAAALDRRHAKPALIDMGIEGALAMRGLAEARAA